MPLTVDLQVVSQGYDRKTCWVHPRAGAIPGDPPIVVLAMYKLRLTGNDVFYPINDMRTDDGGVTWTGPVEHADSLGRRPMKDATEEGMQEGICDFWPAWHAASLSLLGIGHTVRYLNDAIPPWPGPRSTAYSAYNPDSRTWTPWKKLETPYPEKFVNEGAGSCQRLDLPDGDILLPTYFAVAGTFAAASDGSDMSQFAVTVMRCRFDGQTLHYIEHGDDMTITSGRGLCEPSLAKFGGRYFLTIRNDDLAYVTAGPDGLHFDPPRPWLFDDGSDLGSHNTQAHWVTMPDALYLVYTRRGANNDHVIRNRAPLFMARVDTDRLCVIRETERVIFPERGAGLGNFGVTRISATESWVTTSEWMQTTGPDPFDFTVCERYGSDGSVYVAKIRSGG